MNVEKFSILFITFVIFYFIASTSPLEKYKDIAQAPETGVHSVRIVGFALVDVTATLLLALIIARKTGENIGSVFAILLFFSVPVHMFFGVDTALMKLINHTSQ